MVVRELTTLLPQGADAEADKTICVCILRVGGAIALQLRDNRPDIHNPDHWGLFGGALEPGETPGETVVREIEEETSLQLEAPRHLFTLGQRFNRFHGGSLCLHVFEADVARSWPRHVVREGQRSALYTPEEIERLSNLTPLARDVLRTYFAEYAAA